MVSSIAVIIPVVVIIRMSATDHCFRSYIHVAEAISDACARVCSCSLTRTLGLM